MGIAAHRFYTTPEIIAAGTLEIQEKYGIDVPVLDYDVYNIEAEALGQAVKYSDTDMPDVDRTKPLIRTRDDLKKIRTPDFDSDGRFPHVVETNRIFRKLIGGGKETWVDHAGCLVVGSEGKIHSTGHNSTYTLLDEEFAADFS